MPKRTDIHSILILGAGPIVIGQACEFDYSGTQACKALREEGYRIILINSNPATIMTDRDLADATYLEPLILSTVTAIIEKERPDAILPTVGGQTALDLAIQLDENGVLAKFKVELIGADVAAINKAEDREQFKTIMDRVGIDTARGGFAHSVESAMIMVENTGFPAIIRPSFTMGGTGGATAYNHEEFREMVEKGLNASPIHEVLIEESLLGWKEFEMEVVRDKNNNAIIVCSIENIDPMGVHTGDSVTVAPALTLTDKEYQKMRNWSIQCLRAIGVETGGSNVQFAVDPVSGRMIVIEMNPRVSRSSALASKATGFPIAKIAAKLAVGYLLDELPNEITGKTLAAFEPSIDYIVTKIPRFDFEKFPSADGTLGVQMQSVGEVMAIGRTFKESIQKAYRSLEVGLDGLEPKKAIGRDLDLKKMRFATAFRLVKIWKAFESGVDLETLHRITQIDPWFLYQIQELALQGNPQLTRESILEFKRKGYADIQISTRLGISEAELRDFRKAENILPTFKEVDTCAAEFPARTSYVYSTYETENEVQPLAGKKIMILGGGPNRIGQGIEFDYCCVQAVFGLSDLGYKTIMVNCNPETVSTDFDISDRLYFEPLTFENVMNIVDLEQPDGVLVQFGGQTPLNIARRLQDAGVKIIGTDPAAIDLAENRKKFGAVLDELKIPAPAYGTAFSVEEAILVADTIGFPVLVRPSYVLGGRGMEIVYSETALKTYMAQAVLVSGDHPVLIDAFLEDAFEFDVDALCDGEDVHIGGVLQHIEEAGIHSGDSACVIPPYRLLPRDKQVIEKYTRKLALTLKTVGLINIQFALKDGIIYVLEVNPRASRTVPFVSKVTDIPLARYAAQLATGIKLRNLDLKRAKHTLIAVKKPVFPFNKFPGQNVFLSPEMKSTGEVIGLDARLGAAYVKAELGAGNILPITGTVFMSVNDHDKQDLIDIARDYQETGFHIMATQGTAIVLEANGLVVQTVYKVNEGRPNVVDHIKNGHIQLVINTPMGEIARDDEYAIGRAAIRYKIPAITTLSGARTAIRGIRRLALDDLSVTSLQDIFN